MPTTDPLLEALGFEGFIVEESSIKPELPTGFEGLVYTESNPFSKLPTGFEGLIIEYRPNEKFIKIVTSRGRPLSGVNVLVTQSANINAVTDDQGFIFGVFDVSGILPIKVTSGNTYHEFSIDAANQELVTTLVFPLDLI